MPRVEDQDIPPSLAEAYANVMSPTVWMENNYGSQELARSCIRRKYPEHPYQANHPTWAQERIRSYFSESCDYWRGMPANEHAAYYQAALGQSEYFFNRYMELSMDYQIDGGDMDLYIRPDALRYDMANGNGAGYAQLHIIPDDDVIFFHDIEVEPAIWKDWGDPGPHVPHYIRIETWPEPPETWPPASTSYIEFNPDEHERFTGESEIGFWPNMNLRATMVRSATEQGPCVIWRFETDDGDQPDTIVNFLK